MIETLTFLFTDIEGSTALLRRLGADRYASILRDHHEIVRRSIREHDGVEHGTQGDSFFAVFDSAATCVSAAIEIQLSLRAHSWPAGEELRVRMGIHSGTASHESTGLVGVDVHRAARIASVAYGGQIVLSSPSRELIAASRMPGIELIELGEHRLKDLGSAERLFQLCADGLESRFPPLRSIGNLDLAQNLPVSLSPFVGREHELAEIHALFDASRLVTLTGPGGAGKTRLGLQAAADMISADVEGVWCVELAAISDPEQVLGAVIDAVGLRPSREREPLEALLHAFGDLHALFVLDNCEHVIDAAANLAGQIVARCPGVRIVATSREPLGVPGELVYRVPPMSLPADEVSSAKDLRDSDAVKLFVLRARTHDSSFALTDEIAAVLASVCRRLDGIPLALELAAARAATMTIVDLHERLDQRFRLLTGGSRASLPRQRTLEATVGWSYDLLGEAERVLLCRLSFLPGSLDLRAAERICSFDGVETDVVTGLLESLANKSLLVVERAPSSVRFGMLETIREFAAAQLQGEHREREIRQLRRRHAEHFLMIAEEAESELYGAQQGNVMKRLDLEWENLRAALDQLSEDPEDAVLVMRLVVPLRRFLSTRLHREAVDRLQGALRHTDGIAEEIRLRALLAEATLLDFMPSEGQVPEDLRRKYEAVLLQSEGLGDARLRTETLVWLSNVEKRVGHEDLARELAAEALGLAKQLGEPRFIGFALHGAAVSRNTDAEARPFRLESADQFRAAGELTWLCGELLNLSRADYRSGRDLVEVRGMVEEATDVAEQLGSGLHLVELEGDLGVCDFFLGDFDRAQQRSRKALRLARQLGRAEWASNRLIFVLACCEVERSRLQTAARLLGATEKLLRDIPDHELMAAEWSQRERDALDTYVARLCDLLGAEAFAEAKHRGEALSFGEVADLALGRTTAEPAAV